MDIFEACKEGDVQKVIGCLRNENINIEAKDDYGRTPLMCVSRHGHPDVIRYLLDRGADFEAKDNNGSTPLMCASLYGKIDMVRYLMDYGADLEAKGDKGNTFLYYLGKDQKEEVEKIIEDIRNRRKMVKPAKRSCLGEMSCE